MTMSATSGDRPDRPPLRQGAGRRVVRIDAANLVRAEPLDPDRPLPLVASPTVAGVDLAEWVTDNRPWFDSMLRRHGGIVFRDFGVDVDAFERFMLAVSGALLVDPSRYDLLGPKEQVYVTTRYPASEELFLHNETWWQHRWPMKIFFCCRTAPPSGGATTFADCRRVYDRLDPALVDRFTGGVLQVRNYGPRVGLRPWQHVFGTEDRAAVEAYCRDWDMEWEWRGGEDLHTRWVRPVVADHPVTGERLWFNHVAHGHLSTNASDRVASAVAGFDVHDVPMNTYHADGTPIAADDLDRIRRAYQAETVVYPWRPGNVLALDNMLTAHGRQSYEGARDVLAGLTEPSGWAEL